VVSSASTGRSVGVPISCYRTAPRVTALLAVFPDAQAIVPIFEVPRRAVLPQVSLHRVLCQAERATVSINAINTRDFYATRV